MIKRIFTSLSFKLIIIIILVITVSLLLLSNTLIQEFKQEIIEKEKSRLESVGMQAVDRFNKMYSAIYYAYKFPKISEKQRELYLKIFLSKSYSDYIKTFKVNFPTLGVGYLSSLFDGEPVYYPSIDSNYFDEKLTVVLPLTIDSKDIGYIFVDNPMKNVLEIVNRLEMNALRISSVAILISIILTILILAQFVFQILYLRTSVLKLEKNLNYKVPAFGGELGEISNAVSSLGKSLKISIEEAKQTEALKTLGMFTTGVAHEVRNPLTSIKGYTSLLEKKLQGKDEAKYIEPIKKETERLEAVVKDLLIYGKPAPLQETKFNLALFFDSLINLLSHEIESHKINVETLLEPVIVFWDERQIHQLFLNILLNAIQAMPDGGTLSITVYEEEDKTITLIKDTGIGIKDEDKEKIFTPFFTTKERGTGLGLPISQKIASLHNGVITFESDAKEGTTFRVSIPKRI